MPALTNPADTAARLLVVDDQEENREILQRRLERKGYQVLTVANGSDALQMIEAVPLDLVLLDIMMPDMDGITVLGHIRKRFASTELPVVMVTARDQSEVIVDALERGANDYLVKPFDFVVALARIRTQLAFRRAEQAIEDNREFYQLIAQAGNDGLWDWNRREHRIEFSARLRAMLGFADGEIEDRLDAWLEQVYPEDLPKLKAAFLAHIRGQTEQFQLEIRARRQNDACCWLQCQGRASRDARGRVMRIAGACTDLTERKTIDPLTGLPNRVLFNNRLEHCQALHARHIGSGYALLLISPDRFHVLHESLGQQATDLFLRTLAERLRQMTRPSDTLVYLGDVTFAILIDGLDCCDDAVRVAERVRQAFREPLDLCEQHIFLTASMGVATIDACARSDLVQAAETALTRAKERGGDNYQVFDECMHERVVALMRLENELRRGLEREEFRLYYQPIIDLQAGGIVAFEALCRWQHPEHGLLAPDHFIPLTESTGLIIPLGLWVLRQAVGQLKQWHARFPQYIDLGMSINLSGKQFVQQDLLKEIARTLEESGVRHACVKLEITESSLMNDVDNADLLLSRLKELEVQLSIDDFGTGYSSLSYLHRFPFDVLKIDRAFVSRMEQDREGMEIVRTIVTLAHSLSLQVVAEGVETATHLAILRELGCHYGQGYYFAKPMPATEAEALLERAPSW